MRLFAFQVLSALLFVTQLQAQMNAVVPDTGRSVIYSTGQARQATTLDRASLVLVLETQGMSVEEASTRISALDRAVMDTLRRFDLGAGSVHSYAGGVVPFRPQNMSPSMMNGPAFSGRSTIRVEAVRVDQIGAVTAAALAKGATAVMPPVLVASTADSVRRMLIPKAFDQARREAEVLARAAGGQLGRLISLNVSPSPYDIQQQQQQFVSMPYYENAPRTIPNPTLSVNVNASWLLVPSVR